jgi:nitrous oxide reductase accessory protein NosL
MKKFMPVLIILLIVTIIVTLFLSLASTEGMIVIKEGNMKQHPLKMELNKHQDSDCGMVIEDLEYASQVSIKNGKTWFFHDHGGFVNWLKDKEFKDSAVIWVMSRDTNSWVDARKASYSLTENTPMGYGFGAYKNRVDGYVDFETMQLKILRGETMNNPVIRKKLLGE